MQVIMIVAVWLLTSSGAVEKRIVKMGTDPDMTLARCVELSPYTAEAWVKMTGDRRRSAVYVTCLPLEGGAPL